MTTALSHWEIMYTCNIDFYGNFHNRIVQSVGGTICFINNHWPLPLLLEKSVDDSLFSTIFTKFHNCLYLAY